MCGLHLVVVAVSVALVAFACSGEAKDATMSGAVPPDAVIDETDANEQHQWLASCTNAMPESFAQPAAMTMWLRDLAASHADVLNGRALFVDCEGSTMRLLASPQWKALIFEDESRSTAIGGVCPDGSIQMMDDVKSALSFGEGPCGPREEIGTEPAPWTYASEWPDMPQTNMFPRAGGNVQASGLTPDL